jgi:hypothetical protein
MENEMSDERHAKTRIALDDDWAQSEDMAIRIRATVEALNRLRMEAKKLGIDFELAEREGDKSMFVMITKTL